MEHYDEKGMVICQECKKAFHLITKKHLMKHHNITLLEYKVKYLDFPTCSKSFSAKQRLKNVNVFKVPTDTSDKLIDEPTKEEIKIEDFGSIEIDKIPKVPKEYAETVSNFIEEVKEFTKDFDSTYPNPNNIIHKDKIKFLNFLLMYFGNDVKNSYFVNKMTKNGSIEERLVTDIAIVSLKINFEFPGTFWHNMDIPKVNRDFKLKTMGWKIIDIPGPKPSLSDFKEILKKNNLI